MSRDFSKNVSNYMSLGTGSIGPLINGASAVSAHCWARYDTLEAVSYRNRVVSLLIDGAGTGLTLTVHDGSSAVFVVGARSVAGDGFQSRSGTTVLSASTWYSLGVVFDFAGDTITPYLNGTAEGGGSVTFGNTTYTHGTPTVADGIGGAASSPPANQWDGLIAHVALWGAALSAQDWTDLAAGANPGAVATANLVFYMRLAGYDSPEPAVVSSVTGTITGSVPAGASDPPVHLPWYSSRRRSSVFTGGLSA